MPLSPADHGDAAPADHGDAAPSGGDGRDTPPAGRDTPPAGGDDRPVSRRQAILDAALAEFTAHGVAGASIEAIRQRSGASVGSIYHHFGDKDGIAGALYLEGLHDYQDGLLATLAAAASTREGIEAVVHHHLGWIAEHQSLARFLLLGRDASVVVATEWPLRALNRRFFAEVSNWTRPRVLAGELRQLEPELMTALWIGPSQELARHWLAGRARVSLGDAAPVLANAAYRSLTEEDSS